MHMAVIADDSAAAVGGAIPSGIGTVCVAALGESAVRRFQAAETDRRAVREAADAVETGNRRKRGMELGRGVVGAGHDRPVHVLDGDRGHGDQHFTVARPRFGNVAMFRDPARSVDHCRLHTSLLLHC
jgi:hypothetical protein